MNKNKNLKNAFTLTEILIVITIMGVLAVALIKNIKSDATEQSENILKIRKAIEVVNYASSQIAASDTTNCPVGTLLIKNKTALNTYSYEKGIVGNTSSDIFNVYSQFIKFEKTGLNFCSYSGYCDESSDNYPAGRIAGDIYIGFNLYNAVTDCPNYYDAEGDLVTVRNDVSTGQKPKCWASLLIDVNGDAPTNAEGEDIFILGLGESGINN